VRRLWCLGFAGFVSVSYTAGCGDNAPTTTVPFKPTDTSPFDEMKNAMIKNQMKKGMKPIVPKS